MKENALNWFKWMHHNHQLFDWFLFTKVLELCFSLFSYENHQARLFKLRQEGLIVDFQAKFEKFKNQVARLPPRSHT